MKGSVSEAQSAARAPRPLAFLDGGGASARRIRERDWSDHVLGVPDTWPVELKAALSLILNSPESMILSWGPDLTFFFNDVYARLLGPRVSWAMGAPFREVWADGWEQAKPIIDEAFAGRSTRYVDLPWKLATDRGAEDTWWSFSYSRVLDAAGNVAGLFILTNETTDRVLGQKANDAATEALLKTEGQLRQAQQAGGVGVFAVEGDGILRATPEFFRIYGVPEAEGMPARAIEELVEPEDRHKISTCETRAVGHAPLDIEYRVRRADTGELRWIARRGEIERGPDGRFLRFVGVVSDITARKRAEQELLHLNATLEQQVRERTADRNALWQLSRELMLRCTFEGVITAVNPAWTELLGWAEADLLGTSLFELIHPDDLDKSIEGARTLGDGDGHTRFDNRYRCRDGSYRWITWSTRPGDGLINAVGRDFTAEKEQAEQLRRTEDQLRQSQKMEAVGQLTGGIAHDFNNLLTGIIGSLDLLTTRIGQGRTGDIDRYTTAAQAAANRAAALTHRLLAFSRRQTLDPKPTDVNVLVAGLTELICRTVGPAMLVETAPAADLWPTLVDPGQLENALLNLCINARDAMPAGGRILIDTANCWLDKTAAAALDLPPGPYVSMSVSDTGSGMSPDVVARAFDPFFTTKPTGQGTGLGLSMTYGFARQSGGQVRIASELGQGTSVSLYLPRHHGHAAVPDPASSLAATPRAERGETVLVVDDEPSIRMLVTETLEDLGYAAVEAADGPTGLRVLQSNARVDLLITDVGLPGGMNGRQMVDAARAARPDLKVLFITGYAETAVMGHGNLEPGMHLLAKPFAMDVLASRIRALISD